MQKKHSHITLYIIVFIFSFIFSACSGSEEISVEQVQTAIAETQEADDVISTIVAATMDSLPLDIPPTNTPEPTVPAFDYSAWKGYHAPEGYSFNFPTRFNLEIRQSGSGDFIVLIAEGDAPNAISFSVEKLAGSVEESRNSIDLDNPVYTDIATQGLTGFIVEGSVPGDGFGGGSVVYESYFALGDFLIHLDCPWNYCDRQEFDLILHSFKLN
ncbi:MAG: hypothetical protein GY755_14335 [Chloroflexi bacterium]|nr:hypothetical protein [Chloroflexota bacterium]